MADKKKKLDQLTLDELKDVKGGIPYERPDLLEFSAELSKTYCNIGSHCDDGENGNCSNGLVCSLGSHGVEPPPPK